MQSIGSCFKILQVRLLVAQHSGWAACVCVCVGIISVCITSVYICVYAHTYKHTNRLNYMHMHTISIKKLLYSTPLVWLWQRVFLQTGCLGYRRADSRAGFLSFQNHGWPSSSGIADSYAGCSVLFVGLTIECHRRKSLRL